MLVVGLTGGIATGKSTVSALLKSPPTANATTTPAARAIPIIDADLIARQVVEPGTPALKRLVSHFGPAILSSDGQALDRRKLGSIVFNDEKQRKILNGILHPEIRKAMLWEVVKYWIRGEPVCVLDVPLLIEGGLWRLVAKVVLVYCPEETQLTRLMARDSSSESDARSRLNSQMRISSKLTYADIVIDNSGSLEDLHGQVAKLVETLHKEAGWLGWRLSWLIPPVGVFTAIGILAWRWIRGKPKTAVRFGVKED